MVKQQKNNSYSENYKVNHAFNGIITYVFIFDLALGFEG
jgi:hypothetical protein